MGIKGWWKAQNARHAESKSAVGGFYGQFRLAGGDLTWAFGSEKRPIAGAVAEFEAGIGQKSPTLGRVAVGGILAGPAGAVVGGLFQKDKSRAYVTVLFPSGESVVIDGPAKDEAKLRAFTTKLNAAARHYASSN